MNRRHILLVEDDPDLSRANREMLELEGYQVTSAATLAQAKACVERDQPDLIVLDILLPDGNGLDYCRELRRHSDVRILFLSALNTKEQSIAGLRAGGDDYLTKPYLMSELLARVEARLRWNRLAEEDPILRVGDLRLDCTARRAWLGERDLLLKPKEFALLEVLARSRTPLGAAALYEKVWGAGAQGDVRTVVVHISKLRKKLGGGAALSISAGPDGYRLEAQGAVVKI